MRKLKPIKTKPVYAGERVDRTSGERIWCSFCDMTLAAYRVRMTDVFTALPVDTFACEDDLKMLIKDGRAQKAIELPEFRKHQARMKRWTAQGETGEQGELL